MKGTRCVAAALPNSTDSTPQPAADIRGKNKVVKDLTGSTFFPLLVYHDFRLRVLLGSLAFVFSPGPIFSLSESLALKALCCIMMRTRRGCQQRITGLLGKWSERRWFMVSVKVFTTTPRTRKIGADSGRHFVFDNAKPLFVRRSARAVLVMTSGIPQASLV